MFYSSKIYILISTNLLSTVKAQKNVHPKHRPLAYLAI